MHAPSSCSIAFAPEWAKGAVFYQIFPERFRNGDRNNDPSSDKSQPVGKAHRWTSDWYALTPDEKKHSSKFYDNVFNRRYGGDLQGVLDKLGYLKDLGVEVIYFNPVFEAKSLHKYDATMYHHIDVNFGPNPAEDLKLIAKENPANPDTWVWTNADRLFLKLIREAHKQGIRIIIDGVFNHTGRGFWAFQDVLKRQQNSPYKHWYQVISWNDSATGTTFDYNGWWGAKSLPEFSRDSTFGLVKDVRDHIFAITKRWMMPDGNPDNGVDGWRLDVADEVPHAFWKDWRSLVKAINPNAYLSGEIWKNAKEWLQGDEFDAVMNYPVAIASVSYFINKTKKISATEFRKRLSEHLASYPDAANYGLMNLFESHDTDRLPSMIVNPDRDYDRDASPRHNPTYNTRKPNAAERQIQKLMLLFQMTYIGSPMLYYGTEAGMWGADDPDDRKPMLWNDLVYDDETLFTSSRTVARQSVKFDQDLFEYHKRLILLRKHSAALRKGTLTFLLSDDQKDIIGYERKLEHETVVVLLNNSTEKQTVELRRDGDFKDLLSGQTFKPLGGVHTLELPAKSGVVLTTSF